MIQAARITGIGLATTGLIGTGAGIRPFFTSSKKLTNDPQEGSSTNPQGTKRTGSDAGLSDSSSPKRVKGDNENSPKNTTSPVPSLIEDKKLDENFQKKQSELKSLSETAADNLDFVNDGVSAIYRSNIATLPKEVKDDITKAKKDREDMLDILSPKVDSKKQATSQPATEETQQMEYDFNARLINAFINDPNVSELDRSELQWYNEKNNEAKISIDKAKVARASFLNTVEELEVSDSSSGVSSVSLEQVYRIGESPEASESPILASGQGSEYGPEGNLREGLEVNPSVGSGEVSNVGSDEAVSDTRSGSEAQSERNTPYFPQDSSDILPGYDMPSHTDYED